MIFLEDIFALEVYCDSYGGRIVGMPERNGHFIVAFSRDAYKKSYTIDSDNIFLGGYPLKAQLLKFGTSWQKLFDEFQFLQSDKPNVATPPHWGPGVRPRDVYKWAIERHKSVLMTELIGLCLSELTYENN